MFRIRAKTTTVALAVIVLFAPLLPGQTPASQRAVPPTAPAAYDVVSIKPSQSGGDGKTSIWVSDNLFTAQNISLKSLLSDAYSISADLIRGLPRWTDSAAYDIQAKILDPDRRTLQGLTAEQWGALLKPMLSDRFQISAHTETEVLPVYDLVVLKDGPKFKPAVRHVGATGLGMHNAQLTGRDSSMTSLASALSNLLHRTVVDQTRLSGGYDFTLTWQPPSPPHISEEDSEASIFPGIQEQLGLKLRPDKGPVPVLVVDHVQKPSEN